MNLYIMKTGLLQGFTQFMVHIDGHSSNDFRPFFRFSIAAAFIANQESSARLQHPENLAKAMRQTGPEIDGFKRRDPIERRPGKGQFRYAGLKHLAAPRRNGFAIDFPRFLYADCGIINSLHNAKRTSLQKISEVCSAAAAAIQHGCVGRSVKKTQAPSGKGTMPQIHHENHGLSAQACRLAGVFKKRHASSLRLGSWARRLPPAEHAMRGEPTRF